MASVVKAAEAILAAAKAAEFTKEELEHKRTSGSAAVNVGTYYGGGTKKPVNLNNKKCSEVLSELVRNPDVSCMAGFANASFRLWMPQVYKDVDTKLRKLYQHNKKLVKNWDANIYPCAAFNFGPRVWYKTHLYFSNALHTFCAIQAVGEFDATKGGHLYIKELCIFIQFPAGSTILIPSALLTHGNTPIGPHEMCLSFMQFCPGRLLRYVDNGFRTENQLRRKSKKEWASKMAEKATRWKQELSMISTLEELHHLY